VSQLHTIAFFRRKKLCLFRYKIIAKLAEEIRNKDEVEVIMNRYRSRIFYKYPKKENNEN